MGNSCTWVVQEYQKVLPRQTQTFAAEVVYFDPAERAYILKDLLTQYRDVAVKSRERPVDRDGSMPPEDIADRL